MDERTHQIGEAADTVGLSLRTVRYYEEVGLVTPSTRTPGGFRLYSDEDIDRLRLVKQMKPLGFSLEETRDLLEVRDRLRAGELSADDHAAAVGRLAMYAAAATARCDELRELLESTESFLEILRGEVSTYTANPVRRS